MFGWFKKREPKHDWLHYVRSLDLRKVNNTNDLEVTYLNDELCQISLCFAAGVVHNIEVCRWEAKDALSYIWCLIKEAQAPRLTAKELAKIAGVTPRTIYMWKASGKLRLMTEDALREVMEQEAK